MTLILFVMVDDGLEEGEIEGLVNESLQIKVAYLRSQLYYKQIRESTKTERLEASVMQIDVPRQVQEHQGNSGKKKSKKQKLKDAAKGSTGAYYDVYGQQVRSSPQRIPTIRCTCHRDPGPCLTTGLSAGKGQGSDRLWPPHPDPRRAKLDHVDAC